MPVAQDRLLVVGTPHLLGQRCIMAHRAVEQFGIAARQCLGLRRISSHACSYQRLRISSQLHPLGPQAAIELFQLLRTHMPQQCRHTHANSLLQISQQGRIQPHVRRRLRGVFVHIRPLANGAELPTKHGHGHMHPLLRQLLHLGGIGRQALLLALLQGQSQRLPLPPGSAPAAQQAADLAHGQKLLVAGQQLHALQQGLCAVCCSLTAAQLVTHQQQLVLEQLCLLQGLLDLCHLLFNQYQWLYALPLQHFGNGFQTQPQLLEGLHRMQALNVLYVVEPIASRAAPAGSYQPNRVVMVQGAHRQLRALGNFAHGEIQVCPLSDAGSVRNIAARKQPAVARLHAPTAAWAIYQCQDPATGRTTFQERPCEATGMRGKQIEVRPSTLGATGSATATATTAGTAQQLRAQSERHAKERRLRDLNAHDIPNAQARARSAASRCKERMDAVGRKKSSASNNLAGATWEQSLSTEMQAIATQCHAETAVLNAEVDRLLNEQRQLEQELAAQPAQ